MVFMINPADLKRMLQRAHAAAQSAQKTPESQGNDDSAERIEIAYSSHYSSGYFMEDEEYRAEYDLELDTQGLSSHFSSISSSIVPLYSTSSHSPLTDLTDLTDDATDVDTASSSQGNSPVGTSVGTSDSSNGSHSSSASDRDNTRASHPFDELRALNLATLREAIEEVHDSVPTPAIMARKREDGPVTFASLDNRDLPVVREYSAGGLVFDDQDRVAIIARHSRSGHLEWCLPKGHIEKDETPDETAVREIFEETGIKGEVIDSIATIDYWFTGDAQRIHKLVHHYALRMTGGYLTVEGDPDHEAEDATWVKFEDLTDVLSYPNERRIVWLYAKKHRKDI